MIWLNKMFGWTSCNKKLPPQNKTVRVKYKNWEGVAYLTEKNNWVNLAQNAMTVDFEKSIMVEYWKELKF